MSMDTAVNDPERHRRTSSTPFGRPGGADSDRSIDRRATGLPTDAPTERPTIHSVSALRREDGSFIVPDGIAPPGSLHDTFYARYGKRILDLLLAGTALLVALPVLALAALAVRLTMGRPIMFHQERIGLDGRLITVLKLRTMKPDRRRSRMRSRYQGEERRRTHKTAEHPLLTPVGRFLRKYSIDELPQIFNVLRGEMTIVGPRPELAIVVEHYEPWQYARLLVRPGLTGLWQITARGDGGLMHERVDLDVEYLSQVGLRTDLRIIAQTPQAMLGDHKGI
jgi:lipopolysaccharide/colanic/teichoic acid biosynthesis glycosyltransferase